MRYVFYRIGLSTKKDTSKCTYAMKASAATLYIFKK